MEDFDLILTFIGIYKEILYNSWNNYTGKILKNFFFRLYAWRKLGIPGFDIHMHATT